MSQVYEIRIKGHLDARWARYFEGMTMTPEPNDETLLRGQIADQAALHSILSRIRDLGMTLLLVRGEKNEPDNTDHPES